MSDLIERLRSVAPEGTYGAYTGDRSAGVTDFADFSQLTPTERKAVEAVRKGDRAHAILVRGNEMILIEHEGSGVASGYTDGRKWGYTVRRRRMSDLDLGGDPDTRGAASTPDLDRAVARAVREAGVASQGPANRLWLAGALVVGLFLGGLVFAIIDPGGSTLGDAEIVAATEAALRSSNGGMSLQERFDDLEHLSAGEVAEAVDSSSLGGAVEDVRQAVDRIPGAIADLETRLNTRIDGLTPDGAGGQAAFWGAVAPILWPDQRTLDTAISLAAAAEPREVRDAAAAARAALDTRTRDRLAEALSLFVQDLGRGD